MTSQRDNHPTCIFTTSLGQDFSVPMERCYVGSDAAQQLAAFAQDRCGAACLVVSDENTRQVGGESVMAALGNAGKKISEKTFGSALFDATDVLGDEVAEAAADADFIVAIGSGTISDLCKHAGTKNNCPVLIFPTAASMNGYTSAITALKIRGLKRTIPCQQAKGVFADPAVVATAPGRMTAAGVADFLSKCSASCDWRAAHFLRGEWFSEEARHFVVDIQDELISAAPQIGAGDSKAVGLALEALLLSGFAMVIAGSSSPASGGEHLISHYLDMKHALYGTPNDLHGTQVGVATVHCLGLWERVLGLDAASLDVDALLDAQPSPKLVAQWIAEDWGDVADEVQAQWEKKARDRDGIRHDVETFRDGLGELRIMTDHDRLPPKVVADAIAQSGGPTTADAFLASKTEYENALTRARFIRSRFTILDLAAELCVS